MALRFTTAGESHGPGLTAVVEGLPAGLELAPRTIDRDLARRQLGHGRGGRMKIEKDRAEVTAGVRHGRTLGSPMALRVDNRDYANWEERMNPWPVEADVAEVHLPRPGHADLAGRPEVRPHRRAQRARARERARDGRAGGLRRAGQGVPARARRDGLLARDADRRVRGARARRPGAGRLRGRRRVAGALPRRRRERRRWSPRSTRAEGQRVARRGVRGARVRARARARLARVLGGAPRRAAGAGDHVDPGDEGRGDRRRLRRSPGTPARRPTTRSSGPRSAATTARPTARAGSRAA